MLVFRIITSPLKRKLFSTRRVISILVKIWRLLILDCGGVIHSDEPCSRLWWLCLHRRIYILSSLFKVVLICIRSVFLGIINKIKSKIMWVICLLDLIVKFSIRILSTLSLMFFWKCGNHFFFFLSYQFFI